MKRTLIAVAALAAIASTPSVVHAQAVISNGSGIYAGFAQAGQMGYSDSVYRSTNAGAIGIAIQADLSAYSRSSGIFDATTPGCICEGWGVSVNGTTGGSWNTSTSFGGMTFSSQSTDYVANTSYGSYFRTTSTLNGSTLQVQHDYHASASSALFQGTVTLTNTDGTTALSDVRYRRAMDWDVPPGEFSEKVTIGGWPATALIASSDNGFASANPLNSQGGISCATNANFSQCGVADHGAVFDFSFGSLAAGESKSFQIYYGAVQGTSDNVSAALSALATVGAEVYSLGMYGNNNGTGDPITYIFGFGGVGGTVVENPAPEPATMAIMGVGLLGLGWARKRRARR